MNSVYERALFEIGPNGKFQRRFDIIYNFVFASLWAMAYNNVILALVIIPHTCKIPETDVSNNSYWISKFIPTTNDSSGKLVYSSCLIYSNDTNETKGCDNYSYDQTWYWSTVPSSNNWVCDEEIKVASIFAYSKIGEVLGSVFFGWFGDIYGRRLTYIITLALLIIGRIVSMVTSHSFTLFVIGCVIAWFPSWSTVQSATVISMEISAPERRSLTATYRTISYSTGMFIMPFLYWWLRDWKPFMIITIATLLPFLLFSCTIIESPRWLLNKGKKEKCVKELQKIARVNNTTLEKETEREILNSTTINQIQVPGPLSLFSNRNLVINTVLQVYLWFSVSLSYMVLIMSSGEKKDGNPFLEFAWQSIVEVPATFMGAWLANNIGRRYTGAASYMLSAAIWVIISFRELGNNNWVQNWWLGTTLVIINRFSATVSYYIIYLLNMELYPTSLRQSSMAVGNLFSSAACAIAPYLMYTGRRFDSRIPGVVLTITSLFGLLASLLLPETLNIKLPETIDDVREIGKNRRNYISLNLKTLKMER